MPSASLNLKFDNLHALSQAALSNYYNVKSGIPGFRSTEQQDNPVQGQRNDTGSHELVSHLELSYMHRLRGFEREEASRMTRMQAKEELPPVLSCSMIKTDENSQGVIPINIWCGGQDY
jgi:hypothetical protein